MNDIFMTAVGAVISYLVPKMLDPLFKGRRRATSTEYRFPWTQWLIAQTIGGGVGGALSAALGHTGAGGLVNWAAYGACLGIAQWIVLQGEAGITAWWAAASSMGWSVFAYFEAAKATGPLGWIFAGLAVGLLQLPILKKSRAKVFWWIPANAVACFIGGSLGFFGGVVMLQAKVPFAIAWVLGWSVVGLIVGAITGFALSRLPRRNAPVQSATRSGTKFASQG